VVHRTGRKDADRDSFIVLCQTWERLQLCVASDGPVHSYVCLAKQFQQLTKAFGLDPLSRKRLKIDDKANQQPDQFGI
jgi:hypothetical protein